MSLIREITRTFIIIFCLMPSLVLASEIILKSGQKSEGKIIEQTDKYIRFDSGVGVVMTYYNDEIVSIDGRPLGVPLSPQIQGTDPASGGQIIPAEYSGLFDCAQKVLQISFNMNDTTILKKDLFYILDKEKNELYIFTPYFAGKTDLSQDKDGKPIQTGGAYNIRIPYAPSDSAHPKGYYYLTVTDTPYNGHHNASINLPARFLPGEGQTFPDFSKMASNSNGVTITSVNGRSMFEKSSEEYHPLDIEDKIWDRHSLDNIAPESLTLLTSSIASSVNAMPKDEDIWAGQPSGCWGHMGCDYTVTQEEVDASKKARRDILNTCKKVADQYHLELLPPTNSQEASASSEKIKLTMSTQPPGAECRCEATKYWGQETRQSYLDNILLVDKTPGMLELPKGMYKKVLCNCMLQNGQNMCQNTSFEFAGESGGKIEQDMSQQKDFANSESGLGAGDCRYVNGEYCKKDSDCFNNGYGACYRNDMVWMWSGKSGDYKPEQRANIGGCECVKHQCEMGLDVDKKTLDHARILGLPHTTRPQGPVVHVFDMWDDGTVYFKGIVTDYEGGGLKVDGTMVYAKDITQMKIDDAVQVYGNYTNGLINAFGTGGSFIKFADEETPQIVKDKLAQDEIRKAHFEEAQKSGKWETYQDASFGFELSYPATWIKFQPTQYRANPILSAQMPFSILYHDFLTQNNNWYTITLYKYQPMGIFGHPPKFVSDEYKKNHSERYETVKMDDLTVDIDWGGDDAGNAASAEMDISDKKIVVISLKPYSPDIKAQFLQILKTYKSIPVTQPPGKQE